MANELKVSAVDGATIYAVIRRVSDMKVWQTTTSTFVTWVNANIANYDVALTPASGDVYAADFPAAITAGAYLANYYTQAGGTPAITDTLLSGASITWGGGTVGGTPATNQRTLGNMVTVLTVAARNAGIIDDTNTTYPLTEKHLCIRGAVNEFIRTTRATRRLSTATLAADGSTADFSAVSGFDPDRIKEVYAVAVDATSTVNSSTIAVVNYAEILKARSPSVSTGAPTKIAFPDPSSWVGYTDKDASEAMTVSIFWSPFLVDFTLGDETSDTTNLVLNLPGDVLDKVVGTLGVVWLQRNHPEKQAEGVIAAYQADYDRFARLMSGIGNTGAKTMPRMSVVDLRA